MPPGLSVIARSAALNALVLLSVAWLNIRQAWPGLRWPKAFAALTAVCVGAGIIYGGGLILGATAQRPPTLVSANPGGLSDPAFRPLSIRFGDELDLVGYSMPQPRTYRMSNIALSLYFRPLRQIKTPYHIRVEAFSLTGESLKLVSEAPPLNVSMTAWLPQQTFVESRFMIVWPETPALEIATLKVSLINPQNNVAVPASCTNGTACDAKFGVQPIALDYNAVQPWLFSPALATFDPGIQLLNVQITGPAPNAPDAIHVQLIWRVSHTPLPQLVNFVHLVDAHGKLVAQVDAEPNAGKYPTVAWHIGEIVIDQQTIRLPADTPKGDFKIFVGWYDRQTLARKNGVDQNQQPLVEQAFFVGQTSIAP